MKVSVIIPVYNEEKVIAECVESLNNQSYGDLEIVVVDDGSTDATQSKIVNVDIVLTQNHKGAGAARNLGASKANGEILVFVDADMTFDKDFIKNLIEPIKNGKVIGTFSKEENLANKDNIWARCWNINRGLPIDRMHGRDYPDHQKVFRAIKKDAFEKVGGFDEAAGYTDDWSLSERIGVEAIAAPNAVFYHRNPESLSEVFVQSRWMSKRKYKFGTIGYVSGLIRVLLPVSVVIGIYKSILISDYHFLIFKTVSDLGEFVGIIEYSLLGKVSK